MKPETRNPYRAVDATELVRVLGAQCSPVDNRAGYVIGPDTTGRICHVASCFSMGEAQRAAEHMNCKSDEP